MKRITPTELRRNLYRLLDEVAEGGEPLSVERHGKQVVIATAPAPGRLDRLVPHDAVVGDSEDLVHLDWSSTWAANPTDT
mgnify:FL=1